MLKQNEFKSQIDDIQSKILVIRQKIDNSSSKGPLQERRQELFNQLNSLKSQQAGNKQSRSKVIDHLRSLQDSVQKKVYLCLFYIFYISFLIKVSLQVKDLANAKSKLPIKTTEGIDNRIRDLDGDIESGTLRLADEKKSLQEISNLRRSKKIVEGFASQQLSIDQDKAQIEALKLQLDDPQSKALNEQFENIKADLDKIKSELNDNQKSRQGLFDQRSKLQSELDGVYSSKRQHSERHQEMNELYFKKLNEDRMRREQKFREEREIEEANKAKVMAEQIREDAKLPAFETQIQDCNTLIDQFSRIAGITPSQPQTETATEQKPEGKAMGEHNIRKVDTDFQVGTMLKKKNLEEDEAYFVGGKPSSKKKGGNKKQQQQSQQQPNDDDKIQIPLATLTALMSLSIPPPKSYSDLRKTIDSLDIKKAWFEANQERQTKENVDKAEKEISKLFIKKKVNEVDNNSSNDDSKK